MVLLQQQGDAAAAAAAAAPTVAGAAAAGAGPGAVSTGAGALSLPCPDLPGTLTREWITACSGRGPADIARSFEEAVGVFDGVLTPDEMLEMTLGATEPACFLAVRGGVHPPMVELVSNLDRFTISFGATNAFHGKVFGRLGEFVEGIMPPVIQAPDDANALFQTRSYPKVDRGRLTTYFDAQPTKTGLAASVGSVTSSTPEDELEKVCRLAFITTDWAPCFLAPTPPCVVLEMLEELQTQLPAESQDDIDYLIAWAKLACTRRSNSGRGKLESRMSTDWQDVTPDHKLTKWASRQIRNAMSETAPSAVVTLDPQRAFDRACETVAAIQGRMSGGTRTEYTAGERLLLRAAGSRRQDQDLVPLHQQILDEGRKKTAIARVLSRRLQPRRGADFPTRIYVSSDMISDVLALNFCHDGEAVFEDCHRGTTPFAVPHTALEEQRAKRKADLEFEDATHKTPDDVRRARITKIWVPSNYDGLLKQLANYIRCCDELHGEQCDHLIETISVTAVLKLRVAVFESMSQKKILQILWAIHDDARNFFSTAAAWEEGDPLPQSGLRYMVAFLRNGLIIDSEHCPIERILGTSPAPVTLGDRRVGGSDPFRDDEETGPQTMDTVHPLIQEAVKGLHSDFPGLRVNQLMQAPDPPLAHGDIRLGRAGTCLDLNILGTCSSASCTYKHNISQASDERAGEIAVALTRAATAYRAKPPAKRRRK